MRILQLPPFIANQIAAGEVIERPASVVKELLENSKDAGATQIDIEIGFGGLNQIKISDNGQGIIAEDLPLAIAPHATSKIRTLEDLFTISSLGFRGEALASIASISELTIHSKPKDQEYAMFMETIDGDLKILPRARTNGTTIEVKDLFNSAPVRKKFLKSAAIEFQAIDQLVRRFALSSPEIGLSLSHNSKKIFKLSKALESYASNEARVMKLLGKKFIDNALYLDSSHLNMRLYGWISKETYQRSQNDRLWIYINGRMVKDKLIMRALRQAYEDILSPGRHPVCLLYLILDPAKVDVNVHPTKNEVRFEEPRQIHDFIYTEIRNLLDHKAATYPMAKTKLQIREPETYSLSLNFESDYSHEYHWIDFPYILIKLHGDNYLISFLKLYKDYLYNKLSNQSLPLEFRELLVPIYFELSPSDNFDLKELIPFGIYCDKDKESSRVRIKSLPILVDNLDIKAFFKAYLLHSKPTTKDIIQLLVANQGLNEFIFRENFAFYLGYFEDLVQSQKPLQGLAKKLTADLCMEVLNV